MKHFFVQIRKFSRIFAIVASVCAVQSSAPSRAGSCSVGEEPRGTAAFYGSPAARREDHFDGEGEEAFLDAVGCMWSCSSPFVLYDAPADTISCWRCAGNGRDFSTPCLERDVFLNVSRFGDVIVKVSRDVGVFRIWYI